MTQTILVTGATDGIGRETARVLVQQKHNVIVHGRSEEKATRVAKELGTKAVWGDLSKMSEVRTLGMQLPALTDHLDVLINNAGIYAKKRELTEDGFELTIAVNHFAHFLLTHLVLDLLKAAESARIVNVSSGVHNAGTVDMNDLQLERDWSGYGAYASSKLMNVLFTVELAKRLHATSIKTNALHPGVIATKLLRSGFGGGGSPLAEGARTSVKVALDPSLKDTTGRYFSNEREVPCSARALDPKLGKAFYEESARLVHIAPIT